MFWNSPLVSMRICFLHSILVFCASWKIWALWVTLFCFFTVVIWLIARVLLYWQLCTFSHRYIHSLYCIHCKTGKMLYVRGMTIKFPDNGHKILQNCSISLYLSSFESLNFYKFISSEKIEISYLVSELRDFLVTQVKFPWTYVQFSEIFTVNPWKWFNFDPLRFVLKLKV